jgi:hypothetical protein
LAPLQHVLHAAARLVLELQLRDHVTSALKALHWLLVTKRIDYKLCMLVHKTSIRHAPAYMTDMLIPCADVSSKLHFDYTAAATTYPQNHSEVWGRAFAVAAPRAWNRLPTTLKFMLPRSTNTSLEGFFV